MNGEPVLADGLPMDPDATAEPAPPLPAAPRLRQGAPPTAPREQWI